MQCLTDLERSDCSQQCNWRDTKRNQRDTELIVSLSEGPNEFKVPLSQYKNYISAKFLKHYINLLVLSHSVSLTWGPGKMLDSFTQSLQMSYTHTYIHTYINTYTCTHIHTYTCTHIHTHIHTCTCNKQIMYCYIY